MSKTAAAKEIIQDLLGIIGIQAEVEVTEANGSLRINLKTPDSGILIGHKGENLRSLQYVVNLLLRNKTDERTYASIDIGGYKAQQEHKLAILALKTADKVEKTGIAETLAPMSSYERRVIHVSLHDREKVEVESVGEEPNRRIIIRPK